MALKFQLVNRFVHSIFLMAFNILNAHLIFLIDKRCLKYVDYNSGKTWLQTRSNQLNVGQDLIHRPNFPHPKTKESREQTLVTKKFRLTSYQALKIIVLVSEIVLVNALLQCNDISLNPGPNRGLVCPVCDKSIRRSQANA